MTPPEAVVPGQRATTQVVTFFIGTTEFAIDAYEVQEIILPEPPLVVPDMPEYAEGLINLRGVVIPLFDLAKKLKLTERVSSAPTRVIVLKVGTKALGLAVGNVREVLRIDAGEIHAPSESTEQLTRNYLQGLIQRGDRVILVLNVAMVFENF